MLYRKNKINSFVIRYKTPKCIRCKRSTNKIKYINNDLIDFGCDCVMIRLTNWSSNELNLPFFIWENF